MYICFMKIPIQISYKFFSEQVVVKRKVDDMHIGEFMDMYKHLMIPLFSEKAYEDIILSQAKQIKNKRPKGFWSNLFG